MPKCKSTVEPAVLARVRLRLLEPEERPRFDQLLEERHYLESSRLGGRSLRYVAEVDGEWVALIAFSAPALHLKSRENWIGWTNSQRARRLGLVVNNSRFLLLHDRGRHPNLASRILGLCLKRLNGDWQETWGSPVLLVESFVDESRYRGTCYRACGFEAVGATAGYGRSSRDFYEEHNQPKQLYLRPLRKDGVKLLKQAQLPKVLAAHEKLAGLPCPLRAPILDSLLKNFQTLPDGRRGHGLLHRQAFVLACATVAMLMGAGGYQAMEDICGKLTQRQLKALGARKSSKTGRYAPPSDTTFFRVLNGVDAAAFDEIVGRWMLAQEISALEALAIDGKVLRGSGKGEAKALQLLSAVSHRLHLTVAQEPIAEKSNEIPALQPLLRKLPAVGSLITADAMHCQQESSRFVTQQMGGDYIFGLKGNQSGILERAQARLPEIFFRPNTTRAGARKTDDCNDGNSNASA